MHQTIKADISADPQQVMEIVSDLSTYPEWLDLVATATPDDSGHVAEGTAAHSETCPAWLVTIRAKIGPFSRSKKLRMVRTHQSDSEATFERRELDGRQHSAWVMASTVSEGPSGARLKIDLRYDGGLWSAPVEAILSGVTSSAGERLSAFAQARRI